MHHYIIDQPQTCSSTIGQQLGWREYYQLSGNPFLASQGNLQSICNKDTGNKKSLWNSISKKNERQKKEKEYQAAAEKQGILNSVIKHGGPVNSIKGI